jgi:hypothetical protein
MSQSDNIILDLSKSPINPFNIGVKEMKLMEEIMGVKQNNEYKIRFIPLMKETVEYIKEFDEDELDELEISESFLKFVNWFVGEVNVAKTTDIYTENQLILESILNSDLDNYSISSFYDHIHGRELNQSNDEFAPLSALESEGLDRISTLYNCKCDFVELFTNITAINTMKWEEFSKLLLVDTKEEFLEDSFEDFLLEDF